jgi:hypothetical protein
MSVVTKLYFQIVEENNYMFRPFSGWAIIRLRLEYRRKLLYYNVDIKNLVLQCLGRSVAGWPWGPPSLLYNGYRVFPGVESGRGVMLTPHILLVPMSKNRVGLYLYSP